MKTATTTVPSPLSGSGPVRARGAGLRLARDPLRLVLFIIMVLTISRVHQHFPLLAKVRPVLLLYTFTAVYCVLAPRSVALANVYQTWPPKIVAALGVLACISAPFGISFGGSAKFIVAVYSSVLLYALLLFIGIRCARELYTFMWAFVVGIALLVWQALAVFATRLHDLRIHPCFRSDEKVALFGLHATQIVQIDIATIRQQQTGSQCSGLRQEGLFTGCVGCQDDDRRGITQQVHGGMEFDGCGLDRFEAPGKHLAQGVVDRKRTAILNENMAKFCKGPSFGEPTHVQGERLNHTIFAREARPSMR